MRYKHKKIWLIGTTLILSATLISGCAKDTAKADTTNESSVTTDVANNTSSKDKDADDTSHKKTKEEIQKIIKENEEKSTKLLTKVEEEIPQLSSAADAVNQTQDVLDECSLISDSDEEELNDLIKETLVKAEEKAQAELADAKEALPIEEGINSIYIKTDDIILEELEETQATLASVKEQMTTLDIDYPQIVAAFQSDIQLIEEHWATRREERSDFSYWNYLSDNLNIQIEQVNTTMSAGPCVYWLCHIITSDVSQLDSSLCGGTYGSPLVKTTEQTAKDGGVLGINGSMFNGAGIPSPGQLVIKDGKIYNGGLSNDNIMCILKDGNMATTPAGISAESLLAQGVWDTFCFGPTLIKDGLMVNIDTGKFNQGAAYPRTVIGMVRPNEYYVLVADGKRPAYSAGLTYSEAASIMYQKGCTYAYNLDGGGSTTLYFNGRLVNIPSDRSGERACGDTLYFKDLS